MKTASRRRSSGSGRSEPGPVSSSLSDLYLFLLVYYLSRAQESAINSTSARMPVVGLVLTPARYEIVSLGFTRYTTRDATQFRNAGPLTLYPAPHAQKVGAQVCHQYMR